MCAPNPNAIQLHDSMHDDLAKLDQESDNSIGNEAKAVKPVQPTIPKPDTTIAEPAPKPVSIPKPQVTPVAPTEKAAPVPAMKNMGTGFTVPK